MSGVWGWNVNAGWLLLWGSLWNRTENCVCKAAEWDACLFVSLTFLYSLALQKKSLPSVNNSRVLSGLPVSQQAQEKEMNGVFFPWQSHLVDCLLLSPFSLVSGPWNNPDLPLKGRRQTMHLQTPGPVCLHQNANELIRASGAEHKLKSSLSVAGLASLSKHSRLQKRRNSQQREPEEVPLKIQGFFF